MPYHANIIPRGPIRYRDVPGSIGVLEAPDQFMPIGQAHCKTWDENGLGVWVLTIGGQVIPGRWVIIDREFRPATEHRRPDRRRAAEQGRGEG
jgi:hypothetical protein